MLKFIYKSKNVYIFSNFSIGNKASKHRIFNTKVKVTNV